MPKQYSLIERYTQTIKELKELDFPCYMEPESGTTCIFEMIPGQNEDDLCDACKAKRILDGL